MSELIKIEGCGYTSLKDHNNWRIAALFPCAGNSIDKVNTITRHNTTDEVFVLLNGVAYMVTGGEGEELENLSVEKLVQDTLLVIKAGEWHVAVLEQGSKILIMENADTNDSDTRTLDAQQHKYIKSQMNI